MHAVLTDEKAWGDRLLDLRVLVGGGEQRKSSIPGLAKRVEGFPVPSSLEFQILFFLLQLAVNHLKLPPQIDFKGFVQLVLLPLCHLYPHDSLLLPDCRWLGGEEVVEKPLEATLVLGGGGQLVSGKKTSLLVENTDSSVPMAVATMLLNTGLPEETRIMA